MCESIVALITPFKVNKEINIPKFKELITYHKNMKTDGLVICGTTGESATLSFDEKLCLFQEAVAIANREIKIIAATGCNNTAETIRLSKAAEAVGVDQLLVITPYYNKTNEEGLYLHYKAVATSVKIPIIIYNVPKRTMLDVSLNNIRRLAQIENIMGIKEANEDLARMQTIITDNPDFKVYTGNDDNIIQALDMGASGVISVFGNAFPSELLKIVKARDIETFHKFLDFINILFIEVNPIPIKEVMNLQGFDVGDFRLPLHNLTNANKELVLKYLWEVL